MKGQNARLLAYRVSAGVAEAVTAQTWEPGLMTIAGFVYEHQGAYYRAKFAHTAMDGYPPSKCPDLYDHIKDPT